MINEEGGCGPSRPHSLVPTLCVYVVCVGCVHAQQKILTRILQDLIGQQ